MQTLLPTFRQKLIASYLLFVAIMILVATEVFWFYSQLSSYQNIDAEFRKIVMINLEMYKSEKLFIQEELTNQNFYQSGKSDFLKMHEKLVNQNITLIESLLNYTECEKLGVVNDLKLLIEMLEKYKFMIRENTRLIIQRGFKDYGLEGAMRKKIHTIEREYPEFDKAYMLMIRRNEKDFFMRNEDVYVQNVNYLVNHAINHIYTLHTHRHSDIRNLLSDYLKDFNQIVALERKIKNGWGNMHEFYFDKIESKISAITQKASDEIQHKMEILTTVFVVTFLVSIMLSFWLAYFMSRAFSKPILKTYSSMEQMWKLYGSNDFKVYHQSKEKDEISRLAHLFTAMLRDIQHKIQQIEQANQSLKDQNHHLQALNNDLKQANALLLEKEQHIENMNLVKDKFLTILSHDLRSPLTTLKGLLTVLIDNPDSLSPSEQAVTFKKIQKSVSLQLDLLSNLLEWSSARLNEVRFNPELISVAAVIDNNLELFKEKLAEKNLSVKNLLDDNYSIIADKNMMDFIVRNLLSNAIKFSYQGGCITLSAFNDGKYLQINIIDEGVGISEKNHPFLLKPGVHFSTEGTNNEKGTGFGLLLCKEFAEKHGGYLSLTPNYERGTVATVFIRQNLPQRHSNFSVSKRNSKPLTIFNDAKIGVY